MYKSDLHSIHDRLLYDLLSKERTRFFERGRFEIGHEHEGTQDVHMLYEEAVDVGNEEILESIAEHFNNSTCTDTFLEIVDIDFFLRLEANDKNRLTGETLLRFLSIRSNDVDSESFWKLAENCYGHLDTIGTFDIVELLELAKVSPRVEQRLPPFLMHLLDKKARRFVTSDQHIDPHCLYRKRYMKCLVLALSIPNLNDDEQTGLVHMVVQAFEACPEASNDICREQWDLLRQVLPRDKYDKIQNASLT